jgi:prepilin-type N-terminal cleavage/methylation domain-containing protein
MPKQKLRIRGRKSDQGFTLIELLVVIAIVSILAALILAALTAAQKGARDTKRKSILKEYQKALALYSTANNGAYPSGCLTAAPFGTTGITAASVPYGPSGQNLSNGYLKSFLDDPKSAGTIGYCTGVVGNDTIFTMWTKLERSGNYYCVGPYSASENSDANACNWKG